MPQLLYPMVTAPLVFFEYEDFVGARTGVGALD
jgi:hypothetical protein